MFYVNIFEDDKMIENNITLYDLFVTVKKNIETQEKHHVNLASNNCPVAFYNNVKFMFFFTQGVSFSFTKGQRIIHIHDTV